MADLLLLPAALISVPNLRLRLPSISLPSAMTVFGLVFLSYFLVLSGIIYDIIVEPPSIGTSQEGKGVKPQAILMYRINGQFIIEGLSAGLLFAVGGAGFILLDRANSKSQGVSSTQRTILLVSGVVCIVIAYNLCIVFLRMKVRDHIERICSTNINVKYSHRSLGILVERCGEFFFFNDRKTNRRKKKNI